MRNKVIAVIVVAAILVTGGWWWVNRRAQAAAKNKTTYVPATVRRGDIRATISGTGPVASVNGVTVKAAQGGTVSQILAQDGDKVKKGQVVMVLENKTLQASLQQAQTDLQNQRSNLDNLLHPQETAVKTQQLKVESARLTLRQRQDDLASLTVTAPQQGVIASVGTAEGSNLNAGALLFTIFDDGAPTFVVGLSQQAAAQLKPGDKATIELSGVGRLEGTVQQSGGTATPGAGNRDATVPVTVALPATPGIRAGMVGQVTFDVAGLNFVVQGNGSVRNNVVEVRSKVAGTVDQLAMKEGDRVTAGALLAKLNSDSVTLQVKQAENDVKSQEQSLINLIEPSNDPSGQANSLRQKLDQATITLASRESDVDDLQVKAPVDGVISGLTPRVGDKITNNQSLFRAADYGAMQLTITVDELDVARVKPGQPALITLDALPGKNYRGKVSKINPEGIFKNDIATFEVTVAIDAPQGLMAGMNAQVSVEVENKPGVLWLPAQAVTIRQARAVVQVLDAQQQPHAKEVQVGVRTSQQVEIISGLAEGEQVVLSTVSSTQGQTPQQGGFPFGGGGLGGGRNQGGAGGTGGQTTPGNQGGRTNPGTTPGTTPGGGGR